MISILQGREEIAVYLMENGADVNIVNEYDETALDIADKWGIVKVKRLLQEAGALGKKNR